MRRLSVLLGLFSCFALAGADNAATPSPAACQLASASLSCLGAKDGQGAHCWAESPIFGTVLAGNCPTVEKLQLVLNGQRLSQDAARPLPLGANSLEFRVDPDHREFLALKPLVARDRERGMAKVSVSVALADGSLLPLAADKSRPQVEVRLYDKAELWTALVALLSVTLLFAGSRSGMLRDGGYDPTAAVPPLERTYSLARVQLFIWTALIIGGFLYIWLLTGLDNGVVTPELLSAYGIATATAAGGIMQDKSRPLRTGKSQGFLNDILSDGGDTPSLHRLQMFAWTLVLGVLFILEVWRNLRMPTFDTTLLSLMGISGGAYVGLKTLEQK